MNRLLGDTIAVRLLLLVAVSVALSVGLTWFALHLGAVPPEFRARQVSDRIAGVALAIEAAPPSMRELIAAHASGADVTLHWAAEAPDTKAAPPDEVGLLRNAMVRARVAAGGPEASDRERVRIGQVSKGVLSVPLDDGSRLLVAPSPSLAFEETHTATLPLMLLCASALLVCLLAARNSAEGVARFVATAEHFGRAATVQRLPERGPREVRAAIAAFNGMQARIERVMGERTAMLGALSHDLRTPLARLRLRAEFVGDAVEQRRMLRDVDEMTAMVNQSLDFLRDDSAAEAATRLDLAVLLQGIAEEQADLGHAVSFDGPDHATILARPLSLKRAVGNLVENAVKFGSRAEIELQVTPEGATVTVSDDGPGIPESLRELVFEPFYRAEASRNRETGGVGLGLSIARAVIRAHGGEIALSDHALGGLVVRVSLPMGAVPASDRRRVSAA